MGRASDSASERAQSALTAGPLTRLYARRGDRIVPIPVSSIVRIQAQGDYAEVHTASGVHLLHIRLSELLDRLDPHRFRRVHRSHVVNLDAVEHFRSHEDRRPRILLRNGNQIVASRAASEELRKLVR
jgi:two-component system LytT family response regulator